MADHAAGHMFATNLHLFATSLRASVRLWPALGVVICESLMPTLQNCSNCEPEMHDFCVEI